MYDELLLRCEWNIYYPTEYWWFCAGGGGPLALGRNLRWGPPECVEVPSWDLLAPSWVTRKAWPRPNTITTISCRGPGWESFMPAAPSILDLKSLWLRNLQEPGSSICLNQKMFWFLNNPTLNNRNKAPRPSRSPLKHPSTEGIPILLNVTHYYKLHHITTKNSWTMTSTRYHTEFLYAIEKLSAV